jgi:hypothetical protein
LVAVAVGIGVMVAVAVSIMVGITVGVTVQMIDLRQRVLQWADLRRRYAAHEPLTEDELTFLNEGIPAQEYREQIIDLIRRERRSAVPSESKKKTVRQRPTTAAPVDLESFLDTEIL